MKLLRFVLISTFVGTLAACQESSQPAVAPPAEIPPAAVTVSEVLHKTIIEWQEFTGRLEAPQTVELRPRVSGYINKVAFKEGSLVTKGELLFEIDPRSFQLEVNRLQAELKSAQARQKLARNDLIRAQSLRNQKAIAIEQLESRNADLEQAKAMVESVQAELEAERLNLSFTKVVAPVTGRISNAQVTEGNYVTAGQTKLTSLVSVDEMYAYFDADEQTFLRYQQLQTDEKSNSQVVMRLTNENDYQHRGVIDFIDNQINPQTGTIRFRAAFENTDNLFTPGLFVRLRVAGGKFKSVLIDDKAIATDLSNKYVLVVNPDNILEYRQVTPGPRYEGLRVILKGLNAGEKIVTKGLQRVFPGNKVTADIVPMVNHEIAGIINTAG